VLGVNVGARTSQKRGRVGRQQSQEKWEQNLVTVYLRELSMKRILSCVALCPQLCYPIVFITIVEVLVGDGPHERVARVTVCEQRTDGQQHLGDGQRRAPVVLQDVQADGTLAVDVAVVDASAEHNLKTSFTK
jgi:hypothetical protein